MEGGGGQQWIFSECFLRACGLEHTLNCRSTQIHWTDVEEVAKSTETKNYSTCQTQEEVLSPPIEPISNKAKRL